MADLVNNKLPALVGTLRGVSSRMEERLDETARQVSARFLEELKRRQPDGTLNPDPLVEAGIVSRPRRPSVRMGNTPISEGWVGPTIESPGPNVRVATISTQSVHLTFFTKLMGRDRLGTRGGRPIVAGTAGGRPTGKKSLAFWWRGQARFPKAVYGHKGFTPRDDFVQAAFDAIRPEIQEAQRRNIQVTMEEIRDSIS